MSKWSSIKQDEVIREGDRGKKKENKEVKMGEIFRNQKRCRVGFWLGWVQQTLLTRQYAVNQPANDIGDFEREFSGIRRGVQ